MMKTLRARPGDGSFNGSKLSDDVLVEIISRLPAKFLFRFKCVSKAWCAFISEDAFQRKLISSLSGLFYGVTTIEGVNKWGYAYMSGGANPGDGDFPDISLRFLPGYPNVEILDSRNGLVLCLCQRSGQTSLYSVCNPLTKKWVSLPLTDGCSGRGDFVRAAKLDFDPAASIHFRIVLMPRPLGNPPGFVLLEIYSSDSGNWNPFLVACNDFTFRYAMEDAVFLNEYLFVPCCPGHLLRINLSEMSSQTIMLVKQQQDCLGALGVYDGRLYCAYNDGSQLVVYMLEDVETSRWSLKLLKPNSDLEREAPENFCILSLLEPQDLNCLAFHPDISMIFVVAHCKIVSCHLSSNRLEKICGFTCNALSCYHGYVFPLTPCLNSIVDGSLQRAC